MSESEEDSANLGREDSASATGPSGLSGVRETNADRRPVAGVL